MRVALVAEPELIRAGFVSLLRPHADRVEVVDLDADRGAPVDLVFRDTAVAAPGRAAPTASPRTDRTARWVEFTWEVRPVHCRHVRAAGAAGLLCKGLPTDRLLAGIDRIAAGHWVALDAAGRHLSESRADRAAGLGSSARRAAQLRWDLSAREVEILDLIARGLSNQDIAARCFLGTNTVKTYIRTGYRKVGVSSRTQALLWALEHGLGQPALAPLHSSGPRRTARPPAMNADMTGDRPRAGLRGRSGS